MEGLTKCTYNVGISAQKDTIIMRIITVVTLIYLPATFVSVSCTDKSCLDWNLHLQKKTFFSTDVVKYQIGDAADASSLTPSIPASSFSSLAMNRWLQVSDNDIFCVERTHDEQVSLPLTSFTLLAAFLAYLWARYRQNKNNWAVLDEAKVV
jgi:hypothetical protein